MSFQSDIPVIRDLIEAEVFKAATQDDVVRRQLDVLRGVREKFKVGAKVRYVNTNGLCPEVDKRCRTGIVQKVVTLADPEDVVVRVSFPEAKQNYYFYPEDLTIVESKVSEAEEPIFKPASQDEQLNRQTREIAPLVKKFPVGANVCNTMHEYFGEVTGNDGCIITIYWRDNAGDFKAARWKSLEMNYDLRKSTDRMTLTDHIEIAESITEAEDIFRAASPEDLEARTVAEQERIVKEREERLHQFDRLPFTYEDIKQLPQYKKLLALPGVADGTPDDMKKRRALKIRLYLHGLDAGAGGWTWGQYGVKSDEGYKCYYVKVNGNIHSRTTGGYGHQLRSWTSGDGKTLERYAGLLEDLYGIIVRKLRKVDKFVGKSSESVEEAKYPIFRPASQEEVAKREGPKITFDGNAVYYEDYLADGSLFEMDGTLEFYDSGRATELKFSPTEVSNEDYYEENWEEIEDNIRAVYYSVMGPNESIDEADNIFKPATPEQLELRKPKPTRISKFSIPLYTFDALSPEAKEKAIQWWQNTATEDSFAWDDTVEDAKQIGLALKGCDDYRMTGDFIDYAENCAKKIIANHGKQCETYKTAYKYLKDLKRECPDSDAEGYDDKKYELDKEFLYSILEDYRIQYNKDYEYQMSEEATVEAIRANEYEFTEDGEVYRPHKRATVIEKRLKESEDIFRPAGPDELAKRYEASQYKSLNDAQLLPPGNTEIWYFKSTGTDTEYGQEADFMMGYNFCKKWGKLPDPDNLEKTHVLLGKVAPAALGHLYNYLQGDNWSPGGEARTLIRSKGLAHTSMCVGDIVKIPTGSKAGVWMVNNEGWVDLVTGKEFDLRSLN